jgi:hypothetical protein
VIWFTVLLVILPLSLIPSASVATRLYSHGMLKLKLGLLLETGLASRNFRLKLSEVTASDGDGDWWVVRVSRVGGFIPHQRLFRVPGPAVHGAAFLAPGVAA